MPTNDYSELLGINNNQPIFIRREKKRRTFLAWQMGNQLPKLEIRKAGTKADPPPHLNIVKEGNPKLMEIL